MQQQAILASAMVASLVTGAAFAAASIITLQAMGIWIDPAGP
ncbi:MAG: hypothetical protein Q4615_14085 [Paracoccus aminovorans]|nr:hypothetical protein [Paracoccus aminovorans]